MSASLMRIGDVLRYGRPYNHEPAVIDGFTNYFHLTYSANCKLPLLESGINPIQEIVARDGRRRPAILISSSPHKIGSEGTPWQDFFDPDNGHIRYYGDNKTPGVDPATATGNRILLDAFRIHSALEAEVRRYAVPIIFFERVSRGGKQKGFVRFQGYGVIERVALVAQYDRKNDRSFPNYVFDFAVFDLSNEHEEFSWDWVTKRRLPNSTLDETCSYAPKSWRIWLRGGNSVLNHCRRKVSKLLVVKTREQVPALGSSEERALKTIYQYYENRKTRFEALAAIVAQKILSDSGGSYRFGWITQSGADSGVDFVGRLDLGSSFSRVKIIVLGQAKCEKLSAPTNGVHLARTVARLRRGWIGVYVTTSYFSDASQREVIEDQYPILMVHGLRLSREVTELASNAGFNSVYAYLDHIDSQHDAWLQTRSPEEILLD
jgi:Restriction endonuclease AspBHI N-terminal/Restriction endonuclease